MILKPHHLAALVFLQRNPGDEIGVIRTDEQLAAAIVFHELMSAGLVKGSIILGDGGCFLTTEGELAIAEIGTRQ